MTLDRTSNGSLHYKLQLKCGFCSAVNEIISNVCLRFPRCGILAKTVRSLTDFILRMHFTFPEWILFSYSFPLATKIFGTAQQIHAVYGAERPNSEAGRRPAASWNLACHLARYQRAITSQQVCDRSATSLGPVCDQDSVVEFGSDQLRTGLRPCRFEKVRAISTCRDSSNLLEPGRTWSQTGSKPNSITLSWSQTGPRLVTDLLGRASSLLAS